MRRFGSLQEIHDFLEVSSPAPSGTGRRFNSLEDIHDFLNAPEEEEDTRPSAKLETRPTAESPTGITGGLLGEAPALPHASPLPEAPVLPQDSSLPEAKPWEPDWLERLKGLIPPSDSHRARAMNELAISRLAEQEQRRPDKVLEETFAGATRPLGPSQPMINPEGRSPSRALLEGANIVGLELPKALPSAINTVLRTVRGTGEKDRDDPNWLDKAIALTNVPEPYELDPNYPTLYGFGESLGYSLTTLASSALAFAKGSAIGGPLVGGAAALGASGAISFRGTKDEFIDRARDYLDEAAQHIHGRPLKQKEWEAVYEDYERLGTEYGLWEAIPESLSNLIFVRALTLPLKGASLGKLAIAKDKAAEIAARAVGVMGSEQLTETATTWGQSGVEAEAGMLDEPLSVGEAFRQQALPTALTTGILGIGGAGAKTGYRHFRGQPREEEAADRDIPAEDFLGDEAPLDISGLLPPPAPIVVDSQGQALTPEQQDQQHAEALRRRTESEHDLGLTPDIRAAQERRRAREQAAPPPFIPPTQESTHAEEVRTDTGPVEVGGLLGEGIQGARRPDLQQPTRPEPETRGPDTPQTLGPVESFLQDLREKGTAVGPWKDGGAATYTITEHPDGTLTVRVKGDGFEQSGVFSAGANAREHAIRHVARLAGLPEPKAAPAAPQAAPEPAPRGPEAPEALTPTPEPPAPATPAPATPAATPPALETATEPLSRLERLWEDRPMLNRNTPESAGFESVKREAERLRRGESIDTVGPSLERAAELLDRKFSAQADVIREVLETLRGPAAAEDPAGGGMSLAQAQEALTRLRAQRDAQGRVTDDRLEARIRQFEKLVADLETAAKSPRGGALTIEPLSDRSIIVRGQTFENKDRIKALKGVWSRKHRGWVFPKRREEEVRAALEDLLSPRTETPTQEPPPVRLPEGLKRGDRVRISDGTPEPPAHQTRKHQSWEMRNFEAFFHGFQGNRPMVDRTGSATMVESVDLDTSTIERLSPAAPTQEQPRPEPPAPTPESSKAEPSAPTAPAETPKAETPKAQPEPAPARDETFGAENKVFTKDAAEKARELLRKKLGQLSAGIDPEMMQAGITLAGYYVEGGLRKFSDYSKAMIDDLGEGIRPYLKSFYVAVRAWPGFDSTGMDNDRTIDAQLAQEDNIGERPSTEERRDEQTPISEMGEEPVEGTGEGLAAGEPTGERSDRPLESPPAEDGQRSRSDESDQRPGPRAHSSTRGRGAQEHQGGPAADGRPGRGGQGLADDGARGRGRDGGPLGRGNYVLTDPERIIGGGPKARFAKNRAAIETYQAIINEHRLPTDEELDTMAAYTGWGAFGQELFQGSWERPVYREGWKDENHWLRQHLGEKAWKSAQASIINAHYTDPPTVQTVWGMIAQMGFKGGRVLEPSMGIGNFFGLMPQGLARKSTLTGIELDEITGGIAALLYPNANIQIKGYQDSQTADNFYDLILGNWPFAKDGPVDRRYRKLSPSLHDYFFLKALDQVRPGGLVAGITSAGTMDKQGRATRLELAKKGELLAAFRLPTGAFEKYAGTSVVTDILVFRKRTEALPNASAEGWINTVEYDTPAGEPLRVNEYWQAHPDHILGEMTWGHGTTSGRPGMIVNRPRDFAEQLAALPERVPKGAYLPAKPAPHITYVPHHGEDRQNSLVVQEGELYQVHGERLARLSDVVKWQLKDKKRTAKRRSQIEQLIGLRRAYGALIDAERSGEGAAAKRQALKARYEAFVEQHGPVMDSEGLKIFDIAKDPGYAELASLEIDGKPARILFESTLRTKKRLEKPTVRDAFVIMRNEQMTVDMAQVAKLAKVSEEKAAQELLEAGAVFRLPEGGYEVKDVYLSGNVRRKLREAQDAKDQGQDMDANIAALKKVIPKDTPYFQIEAKLGAGWISPGQYQQFVAELLGVEPNESIRVEFIAGSWKVRFDDKRLNHRPEAQTRWGVPRYPFDRLVTAAMNNRAITLRARDEDGNLVVDPEATEQVNEKLTLIREEFSGWVWKDPERRVALEKEYNEIMNAVASPQFDGSFLEFVGMALQRGIEPFSLRVHQINAIWRGLVNGRGLYAHEVGTGKSYTLAGIALESRRYGLAKKPLILAHNANSASIPDEIRTMYPTAKVLYVDNLSPKTITTTLRQIANDDWDAVVMPHSLVDRLAMSKETLEALTEEEIAALEQEALEAAEEDGADLTVAMMNDPDQLKKLRSPTAKELVHQRNRIIKSIQDQAARASRDGAVTFEDLGVDMIIVDEAHAFKKPPIATKMKMRGLNKESSNRAIMLRFLTDYVKKVNNGRGVHLFTGTPITNTLTEIYHQMRYVMDDQMARDGIKDWDTWFNTFADASTAPELTETGEYEAVTRLAQFVNVAELRRIAGQYMDIVFADEMPEFKPRSTQSGKTLKDKLSEAERDELENGRTEEPRGRPYKKVIIEAAERSPAQEAIRQRLVGLAQMFKNATAREREAMMKSGHPASPLLVGTAANNAALDVRLYDLNAPDHPESKAARAVNNVLKHYQEHPLSTQVLFMDLGFADTGTKTRTQPGGEKIRTRVEKFNLAKDLVERMVAAGIPRKEIMIVDGKVSKERRRAIAEAMNRAEIRVVIGNSSTLGVGVNMQDQLRSMHHLDAPWMPGELEQRNGRGWRQGNKWNTVLEYRYLTEGLDGKRWQVLAVKERFISAFLKADESVRIIEGDAVDEGGPSDIAETLSEAAGDPRILFREKYKNDIRKLENRERLHTQGIAEAKAEARRQRELIAQGQETLAKLEKDVAHFEAAKDQPFAFKLKDKTYDNRKDAEAALADYLRKVNPYAIDTSRPIATLNGFDVHLQLSLLGDQYLALKGPGGRGHEVATASIAGMEGTLRQLPKYAEKQREQIASKEASITRLEEAGKTPFAQAESLAKKRQLLEALEADLQANPTPPPSWLRHGAPAGTLIYVEGQPRAVEGHRWGQGDYFILTEQGEVPYLKAFDEHGQQLYEPRLFEPPPQQTPSAPRQSLPREEGRITGLPQGEVDSHIRDVLKRYPAAPEVEVVDTLKDLQARLPDAEVDGRVEGLWHQGKVYLVAENLPSLKRAEQVLLHEMVGHEGLQRLLGRKFAQLLNDVSASVGRKGLAPVARQYGLDLNTTEGRHRAAEEWLAQQAELGARPNFIKRLVALVRERLRALGFTVELSRNDVLALLDRARRQFEKDPRLSKDPIAQSQLEQAGAVKESLAGMRAQDAEYSGPLDRVFAAMANLARVPKLTTAAHDKLKRVLTEAQFKESGRFGWANPMIEKARAGLIDRYGLDEDYLARDLQRKAEKEKIARRGLGIVRNLMAAGVSVAEAKVLQKVLNGEAIGTEEMQGLAAPIREAIDQLSQEYVALGLVSESSYERNRGTYLHRVYKHHEAQQTPLGRWISEQMTARRKKIIGQSLKGRGMRFLVEPDKLDIPEGTEPRGLKFTSLAKLSADGMKVLRRVYVPEGSIPKVYASWRNDGVWEIRGQKKGKFILWRDFTPEERLKMGEIIDSRYTIAKTFYLAAHDLSTGKFLKDVAENPEWTWAEEGVPEGVIALANKRFGTYTEADWVKVPDTEISKTGGKHTWGALAGKYVRAEIWRDLNQINEMQRPGLWKTLLTQWKLNKTARNPVVHMNNIISNLIFMDMADVRMRDLARGIYAYRHQTRDYEEALAHGAFGHDMISKELRNSVINPLLDEILQQNLDDQGLFERHAGAMGRIVDTLYRGLKKVDQGMKNAYQVEDELFRMATYMRRIALGDSPEVAAMTAKRQFLDYEIHAPWVNMARSTVLPFIAYPYRAIPVLAESLALRPWKLAKYATLANVAIGLAYALSPGDEDEERRTMREEVQGDTWIGVPRMVRLPMKDEAGNPLFLDIRRWIPAGDVFDMNTGQSALPVLAWLQWGGPMMIAFEFMLNKQAFTGEEVVNWKTATMGEAVKDTGNWLWRSWMPSAPWIYNSWYWDKISRAMGGGTDRLGRRYSLGQAVASSVGVKVSPHDVEWNRKRRGLEFKYTEALLKADRRKLAQDREHRLISGDTFLKEQAAIDRKLKQLHEKQRAVLGRS